MTSSDQPVGYGRPPAHGRFPPGRSGNPGGRPKKLTTFKAELNAVLRELIPDTDRKAKITKQRAVANALVDAAMARNMRAIGLLVAVLTPASEGSVDSSAPTTPQDQDILEAYVAREVKRRASEQVSEASPPLESETRREPPGD
jgi:hypothetical protein